MSDELLTLNDPRIVALRTAAGKADRTLNFYVSVGVADGRGGRRRLPAVLRYGRWFVREADVKSYLSALPGRGRPRGTAAAAIAARAATPSIGD